MKEAAATFEPIFIGQERYNKKIKMMHSHLSLIILTFLKGARARGRT